MTSHLTASSKMVDLRLAVETIALSTFDIETWAAATAVFDAAEIVSGPPSALPSKLTPNAGVEHVLAVSDDEMNLSLFTKEGPFLTHLYEDGVLDRPSITDNGETIVFVNADNQIIGIEVAYNENGEISYEVGVISEENKWRNVAISKHSRFLSALTTLNDNKVILYSLNDPRGIKYPDNEGVANPAFSKTANHLISYDYYLNWPNEEGTEHQSRVADTETGLSGIVVSNGHELTYPSFTSLDDRILFQDRSIFGGNHLKIQELAYNQIKPQGNPSNIILGHKWGVWLNTGTRVLDVDETTSVNTLITTCMLC